jgi:hypothetical protein
MLGAAVSWSWWLAVLAAIALGVAGNMAYALLIHGTGHLRSGLVALPRLPKAIRTYDVEQNDLFCLLRWSPKRPLTPARLSSTYAGRLSRNHVFARPEWSKMAEDLRAQGEGGRTAYPIAIQVDHDEHPDAHSLRVRLAESSYSEYLATMQMANSNDDHRERLELSLAGGLDVFLAEVPPTSVTASISITSPRNRFLVLRRSRSVRTFRSQWTIGVNETMKYSDEPGDEEDFFSLTRRALREELGLEPSEYTDPVLSWFGWSGQSASFLLVGTVRSRLSEAVMDLRISECHSVYEHDMHAWVRMRRASMRDIVLGGECPDGSRSWSYLAPLIALEMWRTRRWTS